MQRTNSTQSLPEKAEQCRLTIEIPQNSRLNNSTSMTSLNLKLRRNIKRIRHNQCVGVIVLLTLGGIFNVLGYLASVWSAELNSEIIEYAVAKHESLNYKFKKAVSGAPSKYLVGLLNFAGRTFSAIGTLMLVQVIVTFCRRRRGRCLRGASGTNADDMLAEQLNEGGGVSEAVGECFMGCVGFA